MSPRPDVSEERKSQILEAAIATFARLGFQQTRMDDIAEQANISKGAIYLYYKSKDAIIAALLKYFFTQELKRLQTFINADQHTTITEQLLTLSNQLIAAMKMMTWLMPIAFEFYAIAGRNQEVRQFLQGYYKTYAADLARLIQRGIESGEFRDIDANSVAITFTALYEGMALLCFMDPQAYQWEEQSKTSIRLLLDGIHKTPHAVQEK